MVDKKRFPYWDDKIDVSLEGMHLSCEFDKSNSDKVLKTNENNDELSFIIYNKQILQLKNCIPKLDKNNNPVDKLDRIHIDNLELTIFDKEQKIDLSNSSITSDIKKIMLEKQIDFLEQKIEKENTQSNPNKKKIENFEKDLEKNRYILSNFDKLKEQSEKTRLFTNI